jgi:hypothetical protein
VKTTVNSPGPCESSPHSALDRGLSRIRQARERDRVWLVLAIGVAIASVFGADRPAMADDYLATADFGAEQSEAVGDEEAPWLETSIQVGYFHQFETDLDDDGKFDHWGAYGLAHFAVRLTETVRIRTIGTFHGSEYGFDDAPTIAGSAFKPWNTIYNARLNPMVDVEIDDRWRVFGGPILEASLENGADLGQSLKPGALIGAAHIVRPGELKIGFGILGVAEIENGYYIQPLLLLDWKPTDQLAVHAESWTTRGGTIELAYRPIEPLEIAGSLTYRRERFRLKERTLSTTPPPPVFRTGSKGAGEDRAVVPALRISYLPGFDWVREVFGHPRLDFEVGVALAGELTLEDDDGDEIQTMNYDPAPSVGIRLVLPL